MYICVDFDGTIVKHAYPGIGDDIGAFPWLHRLQEAGANLILLTMRHGETLQDAIDFCADNGIQFHAHNDNPSQKKWTGSRKVYGNIYIDDAAAGTPLVAPPGERPYVDWAKLGPTLMEEIVEPDRRTLIHQELKWHHRFLGMAQHVARWSKDPSTKVGAVIVDDKRRIIATGYNGFPMGVGDSEERYADRDLKYKLVVHAEANALLTAVRDPEGCILYTTLHPCQECAKLIIQKGVKWVVVPKGALDACKKRWTESYEVSSLMFEEAGIFVVEV